MTDYISHATVESQVHSTVMCVIIVLAVIIAIPFVKGIILSAIDKIDILPALKGRDSLTGLLALCCAGFSVGVVIAS